MKSIALAFLLVGLVFAGIGYGTWAVYQDTETSSGNYVQAGTLDLVLTDTEPNPDFQWMLLNAYPGSNVQEEGDIRIYNNGSIEGDHIEIAFELKCFEDDNGDIFVDKANNDFRYDPSKHIAGPESDTNQTGIGDWLKDIIVLSMSYSETPSNSNPTLDLVYVDLNGYHYDSTYLVDEDGDGYITLYDLSKQVIDGLYVPPALSGNAPDGNHYTTFQMKLQVRDTGEPQNDWQGDVCEMIVHVALAQDPNQHILSPGGVKVYGPGMVQLYP
jgi:spore coat-associated protein N